MFEERTLGCPGTLRVRAAGWWHQRGPRVAEGKPFHLVRGLDELQEMTEEHPVCGLRQRTAVLADLRPSARVPNVFDARDI